MEHSFAIFRFVIKTSFANVNVTLELICDCDCGENLVTKLCLFSGFIQGFCMWRLISPAFHHNSTKGFEPHKLRVGCNNRAIIFPWLCSKCVSYRHSLDNPVSVSFRLSMLRNVQVEEIYLVECVYVTSKFHLNTESTIRLMASI